MIVAEKQEISLQFATELEQLAHEITVCFEKSESYQITAGKKLRRARELCGTKLEFDAWYEREVRGGTPTFPKWSLSTAYTYMAIAGHEDPEQALADRVANRAQWNKNTPRIVLRKDDPRLSGAGRDVQHEQNQGVIRSYSTPSTNDYTPRQRWLSQILLLWQDGNDAWRRDFLQIPSVKKYLNMEASTSQE